MKPFLKRIASSKLGWTTGSFAIVQGVRLINNVILARIVMPELLGIMLVVNALRTGIELLSDVGIGQNVVTSKHGEDRDFLDTAWTIQIMRGLMLFAIGLALGWPASVFYGDSSFLVVVPIIALTFVLSGFQSLSRYVLQRRMDIVRFGMFDIILAIAATTISLLMVWQSPTVETMAWSLVVSTALGTVGSYFLLPEIRHRLRLSRRHVGDILSFGKWVFLSSVVYFLAMNFDRLYVGHHVTFALLGVYGVARSLADVANLLMLRIGSLVIFPKVAAITNSGAAVRPAIRRWRWHFLLVAAIAMGTFVAIADQAVFILYDKRYDGAAFLLPVLVLGVWFAILGTVADSILVGLGKPAQMARANAIKFVWLLIGLPLAVPHYGIFGAAAVLAAAELVRYVPLWVSLQKEKMTFNMQDLLTTLLVLATAVVVRLVLTLFGVTASLSDWWALGHTVGL